MVSIPIVSFTDKAQDYYVINAFYILALTPINLSSNRVMLMSQEDKVQAYHDINKQNERKLAVPWVIGAVLAISFIQFLTTG